MTVGFTHTQLCANSGSEKLESPELAGHSGEHLQHHHGHPGDDLPHYRVQYGRGGPVQNGQVDRGVSPPGATDT